MLSMSASVAWWGKGGLKKYKTLLLLLFIICYSYSFLVASVEAMSPCAAYMENLSRFVPSLRLRLKCRQAVVGCVKRSEIASLEATAWSWYVSFMRPRFSSVLRAGALSVAHCTIHHLQEYIYSTHSPHTHIHTHTLSLSLSLPFHALTSNDVWQPSCWSSQITCISFSLF